MTMHEGTKEILEVSTERFRDFSQLIGEWLWEIDLNGLYTYSSPKVKDLLAYAPSEVVGKTPFDFMTVEEAKRMLAIFSDSISNCSSIENIEVTYTHRDGSQIILCLNALPIMNSNGKYMGMRGVNKDITIQKKTDFNDRLVKTIEHSPDIIMITDKNFNVLYYNPAAQRLLNIHKDGDVQLANIYPNWARDLLMNEGIPTAIEMGVWKGETSILKCNGVELHISQTIVAHKSESGEIQFFSTIARDISEIKKREYWMTRQALYDTLTGLPNRRHLYQVLEQTITNPNPEERVAILFIDLDGFKEINDKYGHYVGDEVLKMVANRLTDTIRECDLVSRYAGDEFVVLIKYVQTCSIIKQILERIIETINQPLLFEDMTLQVSGSIGVSSYPDDGNVKEQLIEIADNAMYEAKRKGKGNFHIYNCP